ncbi:MAG: hypothetical protein U1F53_17950 [Burkholderiaceae bacterium]
MSPTLALGLALCAAGGGAAWLWRRQRAWQREAYIREAPLPRGLYDALRKRRPELSLKDCQLVGNALRQFFLAHLKSGRRYVSMPSQVADDLWHEFILYTRLYEQFCQRAFGRFLHHTPAVVLSGQARQANAGLRRCWWYACLAENINPRRATRLPLLFALDAKLGVAGGFRYVLDCHATRRERADDGGTVVYCGGDFGNPSVDGSTDGFGTDASGWGIGGGSDGAGGGDAGGDGGDGGGGCGGGGCGGGGD